MEQNSVLTATDPYYEDLPAYMTEVYEWAYVDPEKVRLLDHNLVVRVLLFFNDQRLMRAYLNEIKEGMRVWQVAHVYGDLVKRVAEKIGPQGVFHLTDITPIQIEHAERKLADKPWCKVVRSDAADFVGERGIDYDVICSFFLLHEVPEDKKYQIVDHILKKLPKGGKAIFVDYANPAKWQPIRYILKVVNHLLEPFAEALWKNEISHYASKADQFVWEKKTYFGGVYQCVIVRHKD
ncbi:MAG: rhodoquinone biosynthesis methyltransferase RquA [Proteobacteria bacterium]|jgi:ubiquinone/menaquinone biosynthesis C-methylase UbiE|nr:rhodoquinone biosynthesis methyltransferase RquA [Pseudomonadota bacterium]